MSKNVVLKKSDFTHFVDQIAAKHRVVAPVEKGHSCYAFADVTKGEQVSLQYIPTILPPKKYFMPQREVIQEFNTAEKTWTPRVEAEDLVLFGVHTCDISGIQYLNEMMSSEPKDVNYLARMERITVIGFECNQYCDRFASCHVMHNHLPGGGYDLFMTELKDVFYIDVATDKGERLVHNKWFQQPLFQDPTPEQVKELENLRKLKEKDFKDEVDPKNENLLEIFQNSFKSPVWDDLDERCLSCGNCTNVCPTCYCFDIRDELELDLVSGQRVRTWDGCQSENFAKVAGNENFREKRGDRQKHRYMRKFNYAQGRSNRYSCTGCGRCSRTCMANINLKETINALAKEQK